MTRSIGPTPAAMAVPEGREVIREIGPALRRRLSWAELCTHAQLAGGCPRELRRILGGLPVARDVEETIDRERKSPLPPRTRGRSGAKTALKRRVRKGSERMVGNENKA